MRSVALITDDPPRAHTLAACLHATGLAVQVLCDGPNLVPGALASSPDALIWQLDAPDAAFTERLAALQVAGPRPAVLVCASIDDGVLAQALAVGLHAVAIGGLAPDAAMLLRVAQARFAHEQGLRASLAAEQRRLDERKLVERAKGLLMRGRVMSEDEAFGVLRSASMQAQLRVGQVSERVIAAARHAEAVNRAGQLRMLSQRMVKLQALRAAAIEPRQTRELLDASVERVEEQIASLRKALDGDPTRAALARVEAAWQAMRGALQRRPDVPQLAAFDALAERVLEDADALTQAVQAQGLTATLQVVNLCGRQRMLAQRLAKQALLATLLRGPEAEAARAAAGLTDAEFENALNTLAALPIATPEIRAGLDSAQRCWQQLRGALREAHAASGRRQLAQASEALLALFDDLTARYEHSLQVILG